MKILIINSAEPGNRAFVKPIKEIITDQNADINICEWRAIPDDRIFEKYDAIIISASPIGDNANFEMRVQSFGWIKDSQRPVLGICAGHQFIGCAFGSELIQDQEKEEGVLSVQIEASDAIFKNLDNEFIVEQQHVDSITLPKAFALLASSPQCRVQAMRHRQRPIYGVQWQAERSNPELIRNFIAIAEGYSNILSEMLT